MSTGYFQNLHPLFSDRARLSIMALLSASPEPVPFTKLLSDLELSKGNLSTHLRKLEVAELIAVTKTFVDRKPLTTYSCTAIGRKELRNYLLAVEQLLKGSK